MKKESFDPIYILVSVYYGIFALIALYQVLLAYLGYFIQHHFLTHIAFILVISQLIFCLIGAYWYIQRETRGLKILSKVSLSLAIAIFSPIVTYVPHITISFMPYMFISGVHSGTGVNFTIANISQLEFFTHYGWGLGINFIELILFFRFRKIIRDVEFSPSDKLKSEHPEFPPSAPL